MRKRPHVEPHKIRRAAACLCILDCVSGAAARNRERHVLPRWRPHTTLIGFRGTAIPSPATSSHHTEEEGFRLSRRRPCRRYRSPVDFSAPSPGLVPLPLLLHRAVLILLALAPCPGLVPLALLCRSLSRLRSRCLRRLLRGGRGRDRKRPRHPVRCRPRRPPRRRPRRGPLRPRGWDGWLGLWLWIRIPHRLLLLVGLLVVIILTRLRSSTGSVLV